MSNKKINSALISVYHKDNLDGLVKVLHANDVKLYSTGGTQQFIENLDIPVQSVESVTDYPSILGGRVKTLHPKVFGGILNRRDFEEDRAQASEFDIPDIDLVVVDLYPFEETVASGASEADIIEKIDIGGISLIRAAAKNFRDVLIVSSRDQYEQTIAMLENSQCNTSLEDRKSYAREAFDMSSHYDAAIYEYFAGGELKPSFKKSVRGGRALRYGENPHQSAVFYGDLSQTFEQLHGKELSYNNLVDIEAALALINEFDGQTAFAIIKHTNACGMACAPSVKEAYLDALEADNISAFGGILACNATIDKEAAEEINKLFFEVLMAPEFTSEALDLLKSKKNRILLRVENGSLPSTQFKTMLNGVIEQERDSKTDGVEDLKTVTKKAPSEVEQNALLLASKLSKHTKSNTIILASENRLIASGTGQTSRVDALKQAISKAEAFGLSLDGAVMASDAFFPFPDCVEIANDAGIKSVIQPGGSIKDQLSIDYCDANDMAMVFTGHRHFKH